MPACRGVTAKDQMSLARTARLLLVFLLQSFVVLLAGFAALLVDFEPGWSAEVPPDYLKLALRKTSWFFGLSGTFSPTTFTSAATGTLEGGKQARSLHA